MNGFWTAFVTVLTAIVGVAVVATLVSKNANTSGVLDSFWGGFGGAIRSATGPVTNASSTGFGNLSLGFPGSGSSYAQF